MTSRHVFINGIGRAVPPHDVHWKFVEIAPHYLTSERNQHLFARMADRCQIEHRFSCLAPSRNPTEIDRDGFYRFGSFPDTEVRMARYDREALPLARQAVMDLGLGRVTTDVTHLIVASCTGFVAPGLDLQLVADLGLEPTVERTIVGFMGCSAALPALRLARHIVRSERDARVLVVALELCTLHFQENADLEKVLSFLLFSDGCAAVLVTAEPTGIEIGNFSAAVLPETTQHLTWRVTGSGFDMHLSGQVPGAIAAHLPQALPLLLRETDREDVTHWAIHPGGRTVLDAVAKGLDICDDALHPSRAVLRNFGNMSSATVLFVLQDMLDQAQPGYGCAMAFGPGLAIEAMTFRLP